MPALTTPTGFKEWSFVCDALSQGRLSLILRKGGIHVRSLKGQTLNLRSVLGELH